MATERQLSRLLLMVCRSSPRRELGTASPQHNLNMSPEHFLAKPHKDIFNVPAFWEYTCCSLQEICFSRYMMEKVIAVFIASFQKSGCGPWFQ